jgi:hypothetical protein
VTRTPAAVLCAVIGRSVAAAGPASTAAGAVAHDVAVVNRAFPSWTAIDGALSFTPGSAWG